MNGKAHAIQRINFIQKDPFVLTYKRMLLFGGALIGLCLFLVGVQGVRLVYSQRQATQMTEEVKRLRDERDKLFKQSSNAEGELSARDALLNLFEGAPPWVAILKELTAVTPRSLWLMGLKSSPRADAASPLSLQLSGRSEEAASIARFLKSLNGSSFFKNVVLVSSRREAPTKGGGYSFSIDLTAASAEGKGL